MNDGGRLVSAGVYLFEATTRDARLTGKVTVVR
jgi:hypothetical protein